MGKIAIVTVGIYPIPAIKGGAAESLVTSLLNVNEIERKEEFTVYSIWDSEAEKLSAKYQFSKIKFFKAGNIARIFDEILFKLVKTFFKKRQAIHFRYIAQRVSFARFCAAELLCNDYDAIVFENHPTILMMLKNRKLSEKYKGKLYYHAHNELNKTYGCTKELLQINRFFTVSEFVSKSVNDAIGVPLDKCNVFPNCIDTDKFNCIHDAQKENCLRMKYGIKESDTVIIFAGRIVPEKGVDILISAFNQLNNQNVKLMIVGDVANGLKMDSPYKEKIDELSRQNLNVILVGYVPYEEIPSYYKMSNLGIFPSRCNEAAGMTILEAMACGLPVITTNVGGIPEYASATTILLKNDQHLKNNLINQMNEMLKDLQRLKMCGIVSAEYAKQYCEKKYYADFIRLINMEKEINNETVFECGRNKTH